MCLHETVRTLGQGSREERAETSRSYVILISQLNYISVVYCIQCFLPHHQTMYYILGKVLKMIKLIHASLFYDSILPWKHINNYLFMRN